MFDKEGNAKIAHAPIVVTKHQHRNMTTSQDRFGIYDPFNYAWFAMTYLVGVWFVASCVDFAVRRIKKGDIGAKYKELTHDKRRNVVTYVMQLFMTTMAFVLQVYGSWDVIFRFQDSTSQDHLDWMAFSLATIVLLYVWELIFRLSIGWPLLIHHLVTVILIQLNTATFADTGNVVYVRFAILMGFYATTEQISFVALFCYRLSLGTDRLQSRLFWIATLQAFIMKTLVTLICIIYYIYVMAKGLVRNDPTNWNWFWKVCYMPFLFVLYGAQLYSCKILYFLTQKCVETAKDVGDARPSSLRSSVAERVHRRREEGIDVLDAMELSQSQIDEDKEVEVMYNSWREGQRRQKMEQKNVERRSIIDELLEEGQEEDSVESDMEGIPTSTQRTSLTLDVDVESGGTNMSKS